MRLAYRPEVDGLRAISILAVVIYHGQFAVGGRELLPGGFLGVDVFFVISGYLITSLILKEYREQGSFSYYQFYERRARRLLPALFLTLAATAPLAWLLLLPSEMIDYAKSLLASLFFGSNHYWHVALQEYGAESALRRPLLHTWSLAVEEQFYLLFPALLLLLYRHWQRHTALLVAALAIASLSLATLTHSAHQQFAFYLLPTRFWELAAGALLALAGSPSTANVARWRWLPAVGLAMIAASTALVTLSAGHPGPITLLPVVGAMLVLRYSGGDDPATRLLASRPFVALGLVSYSLYLWHYPLLSFLRIHWHQPPVAAIIAAIALATLLAATSYRWVEQPFRNRRKVCPRQLWAAVAAGLLLLTAFGAAVIAGNGFKSRFPELMALYGQNEFDNRLLTQEANALWKQLAENDGFSDDRGLAGIGPSRHEARHRWFSDDPASQKVLVIGNSHSRDLFNALYQNREQFPKTEFARFELHNRLHEQEVAQLMAAPNYHDAKLVIVTFRLRGYTFERLPQLLQTMRDDGKQLVLVSSFQGFNDIDGLPPFDWYIRQPANREAFSDTELAGLYFANRETTNEDFLNNRLRRLARQTGATFADKAALVCEQRQQRCYGTTPDGYKAYYDGDHWTLQGAAFFGRRIATTGWLPELADTPGAIPADPALR